MISFLVVCGAMAGLLACSTTEQSGACEGNEDGTYWQMQVFNYYSVPLEVRVNGRFVGNVAAGTPNPITGATVPGESQLGEFPVCDALVTEARGTGIQTTKACSTPIFTTAACRAQRTDYCWESFYASDQAETPPLNSPQCDSPPAPPATDACANIFIPC